MTTFYRNRETGIIVAHPVAGIGDSLNSDEVGEDGKALKPFVALPITPDKIKAAQELMKDKNPEAGSGTGSANAQEGEK